MNVALTPLLRWGANCYVQSSPFRYERENP